MNLLSNELFKGTKCRGWQTSQLHSENHLGIWSNMCVVFICKWRVAWTYIFRTFTAVLWRSLTSLYYHENWILRKVTTHSGYYDCTKYWGTTILASFNILVQGVSSAITTYSEHSDTCGLSGQNDCKISFCLSWSNSISATACLKGYISSASHSPHVMVRKK